MRLGSLEKLGQEACNLLRAFDEKTVAQAGRMRSCEPRMRSCISCAMRTVPLKSCSPVTMSVGAPIPPSRAPRSAVAKMP